MKNKNKLVLFYLQMRRAILSLLIFMIFTGLLYPLVITAFAQILFPSSANGSLLIQGQKRVGFELIGQSFEEPKYFWSRPSATKTHPYNALASKGSNLGPTNPELLNHFKKRMEKIRHSDPENSNPIPIELLTSSASGLDPHISPAGAFYQIPRIAKIRHLSEENLKSLVEKSIEKRQFRFLGEAKINVLKLNLALDILGDLKALSTKTSLPHIENEPKTSQPILPTKEIKESKALKRNKPVARK